MPEITLKLVQDSVTEKKVVDDGVCTFAVMDRTTPARKMLFVTTKSDDKKIGILPKWETVFSGGNDQLKRFTVQLTKDEIFRQLKALYPADKVRWIE